MMASVRRRASSLPPCSSADATTEGIAATYLASPNRSATHRSKALLRSSAIAESWSRHRPIDRARSLGAATRPTKRPAAASSTSAAAAHHPDGCRAFTRPAPARDLEPAGPAAPALPLGDRAPAPGTLAAGDTLGPSGPLPGRFVPVTAPPRSVCLTSKLLLSLHPKCRHSLYGRQRAVIPSALMPGASPNGPRRSRRATASSYQGSAQPLNSSRRARARTYNKVRWRYLVPIT